MKSVLVIIHAVTAITSVLASPLLDLDLEPCDNFNLPEDLNMAISPSAKQRAPRSVRSPATITFAANDEAWLYINQVEKEHINDPEAVKEVIYDVMRGDIIALKVRSNGLLRGIAVNVEYQGTSYSSNAQSTSSWKAHKATDPYTLWMSKTYSSCSWLHPMPAASGIVKAANFPYSTGASYVWANPAENGDQNLIWMRHVIGEEDCEKQVTRGTPRKRLELCDLQDPACQHMWALLADTKKGNRLGTNTGSSDTADECRCRPTVGPVSKCYEMYYEGSRFGRCKPYICGTKYECVKDGGDDLPKCLRRTATSRIVPHRTFRRYCKKVTIPPTDFYVLSGE